MQVFEVVVALLLVGAMLAALARRIGMSYPALVALAGAAVGALSGWSVIPMLLVVTVGSIVLGFVLSRVILFVNTFIHDVATSVIIQFVGTFAVWLIAERLHLSPIITMVVFAMAVARVAPDRIPTRLRIPSYAVWAEKDARGAAELLEG